MVSFGLILQALHGYEGEQPSLTGPHCANVNDFLLYANTQSPAPRCDQWERFRYTAREAVALERLFEDESGERIYAFPKLWSSRPTGIILSPEELLEKLVVLIPLPCVPLLRYSS